MGYRIAISIFTLIVIFLAILNFPNNDQINKQITLEIKDGYETSTHGTYIREVTTSGELTITKFSNPRTNYSYIVKGDKEINHLSDEIEERLKK